MSEIDPAAFHDFEHKGWLEVASRYEASWASITTQAIPALLDSVQVCSRMRLLDVACGPGYATAAAAKRGATALGVDFSSSMVQAARRRYPGVPFEEGDAEHLAFADGSFDAVVLNFGMLHLARPESALSEAHRVLRRGGRVAFTVWDTPDETLAFGIVLAAIQKYGILNVPVPPGPPFFRFSDPAESTRVLKDAGFDNVTVTRIPQIWTFETPEALFDTMYNGSVRNAALLRAQTPEALERIREEIRAGVEKHNMQLPMPAVLASGSRP